MKIRPALAHASTGFTIYLLSRRTSPGNPDGLITRGTLFRLAGVTVGAVLTGGSRARAALARRQAPRPGEAGTCHLSPEQTEGPYYIPSEKIRSRISEGHPGTPLDLRLTVVDVASCKPIPGAVVDIWHCDASGVYSGFASASTGGPGGGGGPTDAHTFLRGVQRADAHGRVSFQSIYPGWYRGRTVHIHVMVHAPGFRNGHVVHTGQLYFPDSLTTRVYRAPAYRARASARDTFNATDSIFASGGAQSMLAPRSNGRRGYTAALQLGVHRV